MATGPLKILDFLNRGAMDRRLGPNWQQEDEDRRLKNQLLIEGNSRADITSALSALDKMDELKQKGLAERTDLATAGTPLAGETQEDALVRTQAAQREQDRQSKMDLATATRNHLDASTRSLAKTTTITPEIAASFKSYGINLPPGEEIDDNVLASLTGLGEHKMAADASGRSARAMGTPQKLQDEQGNIKGWMFPATGQFVPNTVGGRASGMSTGELDRRGMLNQMTQSLDELETLANSNRGSIGVVAGKLASLKRNTIGATSGVDDMFHISDNLSDMLLRARSGAQINEQEYARLRNLVPNPRGPENKFFDDLRRYRTELGQLAAVRNFQPIPTNLDVPGVEGAPGATGNLQDAVKNFLAKRGGS